MPRTDKSIAMLTGMIVAALYVILLLGFSRESYMRRDATARAEAAEQWPAIYDVSKRVCLGGRAICAALFEDTDNRQSCAMSFDAARRLMGEPPMNPVTPDGLRRALRAER